MEGTRADVLIETMRAERSGDIALWPWHLARLTRSAGALGFAAVPPDLHRQVKGKAAATGITGAQRVRLLFTREGQIDMTCAPLGDLPLPARARLACDTLGPQAVLKAEEPLLRHKATYRPWYTQAADWLARHDAYFDLLYANERGELCEGSRTNLYVMHDGIWLTPPTESGCLPGTQRAALLAAGRVREAALTPADLPQAQGARLSNALRGWFDVAIDPPQAA